MPSSEVAFAFLDRLEGFQMLLLQPPNGSKQHSKLLSLIELIAEAVGNFCTGSQDQRTSHWQIAERYLKQLHNDESVECLNSNIRERLATLKF